jgi:hypothetical protein
MKDAKDRNGNKYEDLVEQLRNRGVQFDVCEITLRNRKNRRTSHRRRDVRPLGVAEITQLQQRATPTEALAIEPQPRSGFPAGRRRRRRAPRHSDVDGITFAIRQLA